MEFESTVKQTYDYSIRLLSKRDYSIFKLTQKLLARKFNQAHIDQTIETLLEKKFLREEEYTQTRIKQLIQKGFANEYIIQKLEQEFLRSNSSDIESIREELGLASNLQLQKLIEKKLRSREVPSHFEDKMKLKQKLTAYLATKGYSFEEINSQLEVQFR